MKNLTQFQKIIISFLLFSLVSLLGALFYKESQNVDESTQINEDNSGNVIVNDDFSFPSTDGVVTLEFPTEERVIDEEFGEVFYQDFPEQDIFYENILKESRENILSLSDVIDMDRGLESSIFAYTLKTEGGITILDGEQSFKITDEFLEGSTTNQISLSPKGKYVSFRASQKDVNFSKSGIANIESRSILYLEDQSLFLGWQNDDSFFYQINDNGAKKLVFAKVLPNNMFKTEFVELPEDFPYSVNPWQFYTAKYSPDGRYLYIQFVGETRISGFEQYLIDTINIETFKMNENLRIDDIVFDPSEENIFYSYSQSNKTLFEVLNLESKQIISSYESEKSLTTVSLSLSDNNIIEVQDTESFAPVSETFKFTIDLSQGKIDQFIEFVDRGIHIF